VEEINGEDAVEYLLKFSTTGSLQDRDALWNNAFYSLAQVSLGPDGTGTGTWSGGGRGRIVYPGPVTTLKFDNGTTAAFENYARVLIDFSNIKSGQDIYDKYFVPVAQDMPIQLFNQTDPSVAIEKLKGFPGWPDESKSSAVIPKPGYPTAVQSFGSDIGGYYIDKLGYEDVAVLAMASFLGGDGSPEFQKTSRTFLAQARKDGKKKLVIDVSANGGGTIWVSLEIHCPLNTPD
jgi:hypothetical protein